MTEDTFAIHPADKCIFCGEEFELDCERELVLLESGEMIPMKKDPGYLRFQPGPTAPDGVVEFYHADCFIDRFRRTEWGQNSPLGCDLCDASFKRTKYAFRARLGLHDFETGLFDALDDPRNSTLLCPECLSEGFGEGDIEEGELLLGVRR